MQIDHNGPRRAGMGSRRRLGGRRMVGCECHLLGTLVLDGRRVPTGPCWLAESAQRARLVWTAPDGALQDRDISPELLSQLLAEGLLQRRPGGLKTAA